jgi:hypothetical protein
MTERHAATPDNRFLFSYEPRFHKISCAAESRYWLLCSMDFVVFARMCDNAAQCVSTAPQWYALHTAGLLN